MTKNIDVLIVGLGLAGSHLATDLLKNGASCIVIDECNTTNASRVSAGIVNPITGRRFTKSWMYDKLRDTLTTKFDEMESQFNTNLLHSRTTLRNLDTVENENIWYSQASYYDTVNYISENIDTSNFDHLFDLNGKILGEINGCYRVDVPLWLDTVKSYLIKNNLWIKEKFDHSELLINNSTLRYKDIQAKNIVFCEGGGVRSNPYFNWLPFGFTKGSVLLIELETDILVDKMYKDGVYFVPITPRQMWIGGSYIREFDDDLVNQTEIDSIINHLNTIIKQNYKILDTQVGIRPTTKHRKLFAGSHPTYPNLWIFNGLGGKGSSISPYWSKYLCRLLLGEQEKPLQFISPIALAPKHFKKQSNHI